MRERIELRRDNPLDALSAGTHYKAYLVANLALNDGPQAAAEHCRLDLATVRAALAFYEVAKVLRRDDPSVGDNGLECRMLPIGRHIRNVLDGFH